MASPNQRRPFAPAPFLPSTVLLSETLASRALHRVVSIVLFLIILGSFSSYAIAGIQEKQDIAKMVQRADLIIRGRVISTESQWKEDSRGRHIYTTVTIEILDKIKGDIKDDAFAFEVVGGTVDDIREVVSGTPAFEIDEDAIMFLAGHPLTIKRGINSKIPIYDGRVYWDNSEITVESFIQALKMLEQDPSASVNMKEAYQAPTVGPAAVPNIACISPDKASAGTNTQVTITGTNFGSTQGSSKVWFFYCDGEPKIQASIVSWSNTNIVCKVPVGDIGGYPASAGSGPVTVTTSGGTSNGYNFKVTFGYGQHKWAGTAPTVSYKINQNTSDCTGEGAAVQSAANTWNNVGANFTFNYASSHTRTVPSQNSVNEIMWGIESEGDVAVTYTWVIGVTIVECDLVFNDYYHWSASTPPPSSEVDVESVALHEFGHWLKLRDLYGDLGFCHEYDTAKVMYGYVYTGCEESKRNLHPDDIAGICYIYGGCVVRPCEYCDPEDVSLGTCGTIGTTVWGYSVSGNCGNCGKWVGQFTGEPGAVYHFDLCPDSPGSGTANFNADIKITNSSCGIITGQNGSCSSPLYLPNDFRWTCSTSGTYYVIIAPYSSYNSHTCEGDSGDTFTLKYYKAAGPPNDMFANATPIPGTSGQTTGSNVGATKEPGEPDHCGSGGASVWWRWTAPASGQATIDTNGSSFNTLLAVYTGSSVASLEPTDCDDNGGEGNQSLVMFDTVSGTIYQIAVDGYNGATGDIILNWNLVPDCFPSTFTTYHDWVTYGKPDCWCKPPKGSGYQCDGDCDGYPEGALKYRVFSVDLRCMAEQWKKPIAQVTNPCADFDHKAEGALKYRVFSKDLGILVANWKKKDADLPGDCGSPTRPE